MSLAARLAVPALVGGLVALFASGVFSLPVHARSFDADVVARVTDTILVHQRPAGGAATLGALAAATLVWVESCVARDGAAQWCLVERGGMKGWVDAARLERVEAL